MLEIYTASSGGENPKWAFLLVRNEEIITQRSGKIEGTATTGSLNAIIQALYSTVDKVESICYINSEIVARGFEEDWALDEKKTKKMADAKLWKLLQFLAANREVKFQRVDWYTNKKFNDLVKRKAK